jgi:hypothetical protein
VVFAGIWNQGRYFGENAEKIFSRKLTRIDANESRGSGLAAGREKVHQNDA